MNNSRLPVGFFFLNVPKISISDNKQVSKLSTIVLGIYLVHLSAAIQQSPVLRLSTFKRFKCLCSLVNKINELMKVFNHNSIPQNYSC